MLRNLQPQVELTRRISTEWTQDGRSQQEGAAVLFCAGIQRVKTAFRERTGG